MTQLLKTLRDHNAGLSVYGTYIGDAAHADDLRTVTASKNSIAQQVNIIEEFAAANHLKLNSSKTEVIKMSCYLPYPEPINLTNWDVTIYCSKCKCLGVWWQFNLSALRAVQENIDKARRAFFALDEMGAFQGSLNLYLPTVFTNHVLFLSYYTAVKHGCWIHLLSF